LLITNKLKFNHDEEIIREESLCMNSNRHAKILNQKDLEDCSCFPIKTSTKKHESKTVKEKRGKL